MSQGKSWKGPGLSQKILSWRYLTCHKVLCCRRVDETFLTTSFSAASQSVTVIYPLQEPVYFVFLVEGEQFLSTLDETRLILRQQSFGSLDWLGSA